MSVERASEKEGWREEGRQAGRQARERETGRDEREEEEIRARELNAGLTTRGPAHGARGRGQARTRNDDAEPRPAIAVPRHLQPHPQAIDQWIQPHATEDGAGTPKRVVHC